MSGMFRLTDEKALKELLKRSSCTVAEPRMVRGKFSARDDQGYLGNEPKKKPDRSEIEQQMWEQIRAAKLPKPECAWTHPEGRQYVYLRDRVYQGDFVWPELKIGLEVDGSVHRIKGTFKKSFEREYYLMIAGWTILHVGGKEVRDGKAIVWISNLIKQRIGAK